MVTKAAADTTGWAAPTTTAVGNLALAHLPVDHRAVIIQPAAVLRQIASAAMDIHFIREESAEQIARETSPCTCSTCGRLWRRRATREVAAVTAAVPAAAAPATTTTSVNDNIANVLKTRR